MEICVYLVYVSGKETFRTISCKFDITESSVQRIVRKHSGSIASLSKRFISWPINTRSVEKGFHQMNGFPVVIGAIDGSHIEIKIPSTSGESYINRKSFPSVVLQAVVDCNRRFTDCFVGWPGSVHNARMFLNSKLGITMAESPMDVFSNETHILDDSAYLLLPHLLTPYKNTRRLTASQKNFNSIHS